VIFRQDDSIPDGVCDRDGHRICRDLGMKCCSWCESDELFGKIRTYCHTFYGMADGGALAFFQFEDPEDQEEFGPQMPASPGGRMRTMN